MKIAVVVQRYGADINGGAELHARYIAEHLARHATVEVLTTCASDYITWRNARPAGEELVHGIKVRRFPVAVERDPDTFGKLSLRVFTKRHSLRQELAWLDAEGPRSPALISFIRDNESAFDFFIFFSFRYYHAYHGIRSVAHKAILVPTAERDGALGLGIFPPIFRSVRAVMYNSREERALIRAASDNADVPGVVVGIGSEIPAQRDAARFRQKFNIHDRFAIFIGRIDENKGCRELFEYFLRYTDIVSGGVHLVLIGKPIIPIPRHPKIHHLGFVSDQDKFDALAAAELLVMPSYFESLSMVALEAWALGKPVLANGRCDVLKGQCIRSNGGLYYESFEEFLETLRMIDFSPWIASGLGRNGQDYFTRHYAWPVIERKYLDMLERLAREPQPRPTDMGPGWFGRLLSNRPPADGIVAALPTGPAPADDETVVRPAESSRDRSDVRLPVSPQSYSRPSERHQPTRPPQGTARGGDPQRTSQRQPPQASRDDRRSGRPQRGPHGHRRRSNNRSPRRPGNR
jgi:glycosyltransferase involved in cell wall biosynthesis